MIIRSVSFKKKSHNIVAFIPAKTNSKRLINKNFKKFYNKPLIYWTISEAKKTKLFNNIIVSTEDYKKFNYLRKQGVEIHERKKSLPNQTPQLHHCALIF